MAYRRAAGEPKPSLSRSGWLKNCWALNPRPSLCRKSNGDEYHVPNGSRRFVHALRPSSPRDPRAQPARSRFVGSRLILCLRGCLRAARQHDTTNLKRWQFVSATPFNSETSAPSRCTCTPAFASRYDITFVSPYTEARDTLVLDQELGDGEETRRRARHGRKVLQRGSERGESTQRRGKENRLLPVEVLYPFSTKHTGSRMKSPLGLLTSDDLSTSDYQRGQAQGQHLVPRICLDAASAGMANADWF